MAARAVRIRGTIALLACASALAFPRGAPAESGLTVDSVGVMRARGETLVTIGGNADLPYEHSAVEGRSVVVDIPGAASAVVPADREVDDPLLRRIRVSTQKGPRPGVRAVLDLAAPADFAVRGDGPRVTVTLRPAAAAAAAGGGASVNRVSGLSHAVLPDALRITVATDREPAFSVAETGDPRLVAVLVSNARLGLAAAAGLDLGGRDRIVRRVTAAQESAPDGTPAVRVLAELVRPAPYRVAPAAAGLAIEVVSAEEPAVAPDPADAFAPVGAPASSAAGAPSGRPISMDFIDVDIYDIFRLFSEFTGGINIVAGDEVKGRRSFKVTNVPWDQALDLLLKTHNPQLVRYWEAANVIRVTTAQRVLEAQLDTEKRKADLARMAADKRRFEAEQQKQAAEQSRLEQERIEEERKLKVQREKYEARLERRLFYVSYSKVDEIAQKLSGYASDHPERMFEVDARSSSILVADLPESVAVMERILAAFDVQTPAVVIEARIVEVLSDFSQALGVQWGAGLVADAAHGNATRFAFPNSIAVGGGVQQGAEGLNPGTYLVNLPAVNPVAGAGLSLGHIANTFSLDLRLSAMEKLGRTKILSNPKVLVVQNENAMINVGSQLPIPRTDAEGNRTVEWRDVGILLKVRPAITNDGMVFMELEIEKSARGETVQTTEGSMFSIEKRGAVTKVLIGDGETSVIGGIFQQTSVESESGVPWFSRLPVLGWLFRAKNRGDDRKELMIFLTPRILKRGEPVSG